LEKQLFRSFEEINFAELGITGKHAMQPFCVGGIPANMGHHTGKEERGICTFSSQEPS
jgi:hypothetical protein